MIKFYTISKKEKIVISNPQAQQEKLKEILYKTAIQPLSSYGSSSGLSFLLKTYQ